MRIFVWNNKTKDMNAFKQLKENQFKVSQLETVSIEVSGFENETEKAVHFLILSNRGDMKSVWIPRSVFTHGKNETILVKGWFAAKNIFYAVNKKYFA